MLGYNPLVTRDNVPLDDIDSRIGFALLLLLLNGLDDDDRLTSNRPLGNRPFFTRPRMEIRPQI